jgi:biopolymer transport protein ExbB/TolQ
MAHTGRGASLVYTGTLAMLALAFAFPIALMIFNPTLMFERGWEQYVGSGIYFWAVLTLVRELIRLWRDERSFKQAPALLEAPRSIGENDRRVLPGRLRQLAAYAGDGGATSVEQLMELNREGSGLDQEHLAGRFTLTRYILYLLPVIGFIGTVEGISKALMNISRVLPMVKDLDGFMSNLTSVTSALQIAFDSTLLALFLSAALMLVQTLVHRRAEDLLARVDRWVVEHVLPRYGRQDSAAIDISAALVEIHKALSLLNQRLDEGLGKQVDRFASSIDRLSPAVVALQQGAEAIGRLGADLEAAGQAGESIRRGVAILTRIETALAQGDEPDEQLEQIRRGVDRSGAAIEALAGQWSAAFERSSRTTQEQLARTLSSLKDALDLLQVSMEQGNALYRNIVKKMLPVYPSAADDMAA